MDALLQIQEEVTTWLDKVCGQFRYIPFHSLRKMVIANEVNAKMPHLIGKDGRVGAGGIVNMPVLEGLDPDSSAIQSDLLLSIDVIEHPELNMRSGSGTMMEAEPIARAVRAALHQQSFEGLALFYHDRAAIVPIEGIENRWKGCLGYTVNLRARLAEDAVLKTPLPGYACPEHIVTFADVSPAVTYYTVDGSLPFPASKTSIIYTAPFEVPVGAIVRWAAFQPGYFPSDIGLLTIT